MSESTPSRVAVITGATSGIGLATARLLASTGHKVFIGARNPENVASTVKELQAEILNVDGAVVDVRDTASVEAFVQAAVDRFGTVDVLVNNAGRSGGGVTADLTDELWEDVLETNLNSVFRVTRAVLNTGGMREKNRGRIINIASTAGKQGVVLGAPYSASKHGVVGFTKALGNELAPTGITVNAVCPGYVLTPLVQKQIPDTAKARGISEDQVVRDVLLAAQPTKKFVTVEEVAAFTAFLCSEDAASITGAVLPIEGGWTAH